MITLMLFELLNNVCGENYEWLFKFCKTYTSGSRLCGEKINQKTLEWRWMETNAFIIIRGVMLEDMHKLRNAEEGQEKVIWGFPRGYLKINRIT